MTQQSPAAETIARVALALAETMPTGSAHPHGGPELLAAIETCCRAGFVVALAQDVAALVASAGAETPYAAFQAADHSTPYAVVFAGHDPFAFAAAVDRELTM